MKIPNYSVLKEIAKVDNVPERINLYTRENKCETVLDLVGAVGPAFDREYNYRYDASYPYTVTYNDAMKDEILCIDFSGGPALSIGSTIKSGKNVFKIVEISNGLIVVKK